MEGGDTRSVKNCRKNENEILVVRDGEIGGLTGKEVRDAVTLHWSKK